MRTSSHRNGHRQLCSVALSLLLFLPAVPAAAEGDSARGGFELHLEEALAFQGSAFAVDETADGEGGPTREVRFTDVEPRSLREVALQVSAQQAGPDPADQMKSEKGFGRWLKKHWYVPVLAAVAIGVAVGGGDDTDASGEEDE